MDPILAFFIEHWLLSSLFVAIIILLLINEWRHRAFGVMSVNPSQLVDLLNHANGVVVDVRSPANFDQGHIIGAINLPAAEFNKGTNQLSKYKSKPLIVVCAQGVDSPKMGKLLKEQGFTQAYFLMGGMDAWQSQNMPLVGKK